MKIECKDVHKNEGFANFSEESWEKVSKSGENGARSPTFLNTHSAGNHPLLTW